MKRKPEIPVSAANDLWVAQHLNLKTKGNETQSNVARILELADIALGNRKPQGKKKHSKVSDATNSGQ
jgi:hypothetical protein